MLAAVLGGADQHDLARLGREMLDRAQTSPDRDSDGFEERALWLGTTFGGAGRLHADLTPACAAALTVVLEALGQKAGPEDTRTAAQRRHDAVEEACRRLIGGQLIPGRDGQPPHLTVHIDLTDLRGGSAGSVLERSWTPARAAAGPGSVYLTGPAAEAAACDAVVTPMVTGQIDWAVLDQLTTVWLTTHGHGPHRQPAGRPPGPATEDHAGRQAGRPGRGRLQQADRTQHGTQQEDPPDTAAGRPRRTAGRKTTRTGRKKTGRTEPADGPRTTTGRTAGRPPGRTAGRPPRRAAGQTTRTGRGTTRTGTAPGTGRRPGHRHVPFPGTGPGPGRGRPAAADDHDCGIAGCLEATRRRLQATILRWSLDLLSGPGGLASHLRGTVLGAPFNTPQPATGPRPHHPHHPAPPAHRRHPARPALRVPRLHPATVGLRRAPPDPLGQGRPHQPGQPPIALPISPPHRHPPLGLENHLPPRRHHHRHRTRRTHPPQPRTTPASRLTGGEKAHASRPDPPRHPGTRATGHPGTRPGSLLRACSGDWCGSR